MLSISIGDGDATGRRGSMNSETDDQAPPRIGRQVGEGICPRSLPEVDDQHARQQAICTACTTEGAECGRDAITVATVAKTTIGINAHFGPRWNGSPSTPVR